MKKLLVSLLVMALVPLIGCESKSSPGGPGATRTTDRGTGAHTTAAGKSEDTFTIATPTLTTDLKQGESKEVTISIQRGSNFKQDVQLKINAPQGLKVTPANPTIKASEENAKVMVEALNEAPLGPSTIEVTAAPETGVSTAASFKVDVKKGGSE
jgi:uncharacterized membrane protein